MENIDDLLRMDLNREVKYLNDNSIPKKTEDWNITCAKKVLKDFIEKGNKMKEILFRGKRTDSDLWVEGNLVMVFDPETLKKYPFIVISYNHDTFDWIEVIPETVCQFTTKTDDNGKKIFWDDYLKPFGEGITFMLVKYVEGELIVYNNYGRWGTLSRFFDICNQFGLKIEITGNIHDNG